MKKFFTPLLIAATLGSSAGVTQAMPLGSSQTQDSLVVLVAGGCGAGFHRGPGGRCRVNGYYGGRYWGDPVVVAPRAVVAAPGPVLVAPGAPCGGRGRHRVCNGMGNCWMVCN